MDWDDVRHFLALARLGSVRAAGAALGVSHSTVARRVEALEGQLSARLFDRHRDGYRLTAAGRQMLPGAERVEREMSALERGLAGQDARLVGSVALTCCDSYISGLLLAELSGFCAEHPHIELVVTNDSRSFDLAKREADVAIRTLAVGAQPPGYLIGTRLVPLVVASYVGVAHAARLDPEHAGSQPRWLAFDSPKHVQMMIAGSSYQELPPWGSFSTLELLTQAACQGLGLVMLPTYVGDREPALRRLAEPDLRHVADVWMLSHPDLRDNARFRATRAAVAAGLRRHEALFRGQAEPGGWCADRPEGPGIAPDSVGRPLVQ